MKVYYDNLPDNLRIQILFLDQNASTVTQFLKSVTAHFTNKYGLDAEFKCDDDRLYYQQFYFEMTEKTHTLFQLMI